MELSSTQAAKIIGVSEPTIRQYVERGLLLGRRMGIRRIVRIKPDDLRVFAMEYGYTFDDDLLRRILSE